MSESDIAKMVRGTGPHPTLPVKTSLCGESAPDLYPNGFKSNCLCHYCGSRICLAWSNSACSGLEIRQGANWNARCFLAIEVEDSKGSKHLLGDMINVGIAGRIGFITGYNKEKYETLLRQLEYIVYRVEAKKIKFNSRNILVLKPSRFEDIIPNNLSPER